MKLEHVIVSVQSAVGPTEGDVRDGRFGEHCKSPRELLGRQGGVGAVEHGECRSCEDDAGNGEKLLFAQRQDVAGVALDVQSAEPLQRGLEAELSKDRVDFLVADVPFPSRWTKPRSAAGVVTCRGSRV